MQANAVAVGIDTPPASPSLGQCWIVGNAPTDAWTGQAGSLAGWTGGGWRFVAAFEGMSVWDVATGEVVRRVAGSWMSGTIAGARLVVAGIQVVGAQQAAIAAPVGGTVIDTQGRAALAAILTAMRTHGLIAA